MTAPSMRAERDGAAATSVVHVTGGRVFGGIETMLLALADATDAPSPVAMAFGGRLADAMRERGHPHVVFGGEDMRASRPLGIWRARGQLARALRDADAQVAIYHGPWTYALFAGAAGAAAATPVLMLHGGFPSRFFPDTVTRWRRPRAVIANSEWTAAQARAALPHASVAVVHPAVSAAPPVAAAERARLRAELGASPDDVVVLLVGRMEEWKGQEVLLDALERLGPASGWRCWIVGGAQRSEELALVRRLEARAASPALAGRVRVLGQREDVRALMAAADVYCQPNLRPEPFGIALVEALAAGLPVVTTAAGGASEIVDERCGIAVPPGERAALAAGVATALGALVGDAAMRARLASRAADRAAEIADPVRQGARLVATALQLAKREPRPASAPPRAAASLGTATGR